MSDRLLSGNTRLDQILGGGLPEGGVNMIVGAPGSGKTMIVQQYVFAAATEKQPSLYFATVSEPFDKLVPRQAGIRFQSQSRWFESSTPVLT